MSLPENICTKCYDDLNVAYNFRKKCEESSIILKSIVKSAEIDTDSQAISIDPICAKVEETASNDIEDNFCASNVDDSEYIIEPSNFDESEYNSIVKIEAPGDMIQQNEEEVDDDETRLYFEEEFIVPGVSIAFQFGF